MIRKRSYPDTQLGHARSHKDSQDGRLSGTGHAMVWRKIGKTRYLGTCRRCGGQLDCDEYGSHWRSAPGRPSLLKWKGVNVIRRCPGGG